MLDLLIGLAIMCAAIIAGGLAGFGLIVVILLVLARFFDWLEGEGHDRPG